jgi:quercetin dioxygenase-like cupin family protein
MANVGEAIVNPRTGQRMRFLRTAATSDGAVFEVETVNPRGPAEPEHVHPEQESGARVVAGTLHFSIRGKTHVVPAGGAITIAANTPHNFWNAGAEEAVAVQFFRPALRIEDFFESYFGLARDGLLNAQGLPGLLRMAVMTQDFWREIRVTQPPAPVQRAFAALVSPLGRWRGYRARYAEEASPIAPP